MEIAYERYICLSRTESVFRTQKSTVVGKSAEANYENIIFNNVIFL